MKHIPLEAEANAAMKVVMMMVVMVTSPRR